MCEVLTTFLVQDRTPDQYKTVEPLFIQIGSLEPDLLIFEVLAKKFDARHSLFFWKLLFAYFVKYLCKDQDPQKNIMSGKKSLA